ncbi:DUF1893 domain-containing protein [Candidatus Bathyarchaeota archaeon]|nr:DUF1893 domain-containing protein [Candidatus Bathyarchaeota archaeon]
MNEKKLREYLTTLNRWGVNLYIFKEDRLLYRSARSGIAPLIEAVESFGVKKLSGSTVVDKIVGKAAALILSYFKAREVYTRVISRSAARILDENRISFYFKSLTDEIKSKDGLSICPFELAVKEIDEPKLGYLTLRKLLKKTPAFRREQKLEDKPNYRGSSKKPNI